MAAGKQAAGAPENKVGRRVSAAAREPGAKLPLGRGDEGSLRYQPAFPAEYREKCVRCVATPLSFESTGPLPVPLFS